MFSYHFFGRVIVRRRASVACIWVASTSEGSIIVREKLFPKHSRHTYCSWGTWVGGVWCPEILLVVVQRNMNIFARHTRNCSCTTTDVGFGIHLPPVLRVVFHTCSLFLSLVLYRTSRVTGRYGPIKYRLKKSSETSLIHGLIVSRSRTRPFQGCNTGSNPLRP